MTGSLIFSDDLPEKNYRSTEKEFSPLNIIDKNSPYA